MQKWKKHLEILYYHFTHVYHKWQSYNVLFLRYQARRTESFVILDHFFALLPPNNRKNQNFEKLKKTSRDIIILHKYNKNHDHMLYCSWDMVHDRCYYFFILGHFLLFYPSNRPKNLNLKNVKKTPGDIIILHKCTKNHDHMLHCSWDMVHNRCNCYFSFWAIL